MPAAIVILAAGAGSRVGAERNKVLLPLAGVPLVVHSLRAALAVADVARVVVVVREGELRDVGAALLPELGERDVVLTGGGSTRHESEWQALQLLRTEIDSGAVDVVAIHDAARPLAPAQLFAEVVAAAREHGGAVPGAAVRGLTVRATLAPVAGAVVAVQTPQAFRARPLLAAYTRAAGQRQQATDTAGVLAEHDGSLRVVALPAPPTNLKVTFPEDLAVAAALLAGPQWSGPLPEPPPAGARALSDRGR